MSRTISCFDCHEWCDPRAWCKGCALPAMEVRIEELEAENADLRRTIDGLSTANHWQVSPPLSEDTDR